jgi:RNA polymerase sigma-70 factor (ECF subfamily)
VTSRVLGTGSDAEDAAQEAVLRAFRAIDAGTEPAHLEAWLTTIAKREAYRVHQRRRLTEPIDDQPASWHQDLTNVDHSDTTIDKLSVRDLLGEADPLDQILLLHRFLLDQTTAEIARAMRMPDATVRVRLHRALKNLRRIQNKREQDKPT